MVDGRYVRTVGVVLGGLVLVQLAIPVRAHVDYVVDDPAEVADILQFMLDTLLDPVNAVLVVLGGLLPLVAAVVYLWLRPVAVDIAAFRDTMAGYRELVPWLLRISVGFPLVGAGFSGYLLSPSVPIEARLLQVTLGFLLLFGLATRATALAGLLTFGGTLLVDARVLLAGELVPGFLAIALLGPGHPSADDVLADLADAEGTTYGRFDPVHQIATWANDRLGPYEPYAATIVRVGIGLNFLYLGITQKLLNPGLALAVVAKYDLSGFVPVAPELWVVGAGLAEAGLGIVLVVGVFSRAAAVTALAMFTLTLFGLPDDPVLAHLSLFGLTSSILINGSGPLALDRRLLKWRDRLPSAVVPS